MRAAYHLYRSHPGDGSLAPMSGTGGFMGGLDTVRVPASEIVHLFRPLRPGQIRGEPWLARALVKLNELDQYDDAELVRKKTAAMFAGFITRMSPEDNLMGEGLADANGAAMAGLEPGTMQILEPGEDVKFSQPADVGASYAEFLQMQFRAVADNGYNLSVSSYVETKDTREAVDIKALNAQIANIVVRQAALRTQIDAIVADLEGEEA